MCSHPQAYSLLLVPHWNTNQHVAALLQLLVSYGQRQDVLEEQAEAAAYLRLLAALGSELKQCSQHGAQQGCQRADTGVACSESYCSLLTAMCGSVGAVMAEMEREMERERRREGKEPA